jgi:polyhydroxyalkanoate synthase
MKPAHATAADAAFLQPWGELTSQWQQALQRWNDAWTRGFAGPSGRTASAGRVRGDPSAGAACPFDTGALAKLNQAFAPRFAQLSAAVAQALARPGASMPEIVAQPQGDKRFAADVWREQPYFSWIRQAYLLYSEYLLAMAGAARLPADEQRRLEFAIRQFVDALAPTNYPATNPDVLRRAIETDGASILAGLRNFAADVAKRRITMTDESAFAVGRNLAVTPGSVVFRNALIELIQYDATTTKVAKRPLVIVPPCINKYYVLDLRPENSFVRHAVAQGHTVFMISWRNVPASLGDLTWDDYLEHGVLAAIDVARSIAASPTVNALGFCVGGTLLTCALAVLAAREARSVSSATLLTTMLDFADPGEIDVYISRASLAAREPALMSGQRVHGSELAGAFASLRPNDLVWNYVVNNYLKGRTPPPFDLLYWNGDSANLPGPMYAYYLKNLYVDNRLRERGALTMLGERIDLSTIRAPAYVFASHDDHIVPWRSAYRTIDLLGGTSTFVVGASGHIAGVVNPPASGKRNYWTNDARSTNPDEWMARAASHPGSWWPHWYRWLDAHSGGQRPAPAAAGNADYPALDAAPGRYVLETA